jgi:DNA-binding beta-propeller fold protein YncE
VLHTVVLETGDEPGRVVEDAAGRIHVALRRAGAVVTVNATDGVVLRREAVCGAPRGLAYDPDSNQVHVACVGGQLVTLAADSGAIVRTVDLGPGLRDVVVRRGRLLVSRFKSTEVLKVAPDGQVLTRAVAPGIQRQSDPLVSDPTALVSDPTALDAGTLVESVEPGGAWRMVARGSEEAFVLHQYALTTPINVNRTRKDAGSAPPPGESGPYGAPPGGCGGLLQPTVGLVNPDGTFQPSAPISLPVVAVDAAVSPDNRWIAIAHPGTPDANSPNLSRLSAIHGPGAVSIVDGNDLAAHRDKPNPCKRPMFLLPVPGQATAVAFNPTIGDAVAMHDTWFVVQTREPAQLVFYRDPLGGTTTTVSLGGPSMLDTGHELFHRDTGAGIACASCHLEGSEDGRVWKFDPIGDRRTQSLEVGLKDTAPFHWDGDMTTFTTLMNEVFVHRMGGAPQTEERNQALLNWISQLTPPARIRGASDAAVLRGKALFDSSAVGCASCHAGAHGQSFFVGTTPVGHALQVPKLTGVGFRAPFLHNGCAKTLLNRFDPACGGGDQHGKTSHLNAAAKADLVAYLESL